MIIDEEHKKHFYQGIKAYNNGSPRPGSPHSALIRMPPWEKVIDAYADGWDVAQSVHINYGIKLEPEKLT